MDAYQRASRLQYESLSIVQQVGEEVEKKKNVAEIRAIFLNPLAAAECEPKAIANASPAMLLLIGEDIKLIHVKGVMRDKEIGRGLAKYLTETAPLGAKFFVRGAACMNSSAERIWKGVGFVSSSSVTATTYHTRSSERTKTRPPRGADTLYLSFQKE